MVMYHTEREHMKLITLYIPEPYLKALDRLIHERRLYPNRAEAIRLAVRDLLMIEIWEVAVYGSSKRRSVRRRTEA